ncbi:MAG: glutamine synthetase [Omnitrophica WOR_2 bacterium GWF2_38_59]|nr:MAG: glutamine synthetase [Omnitrophica WOR_2 bacterium GWF2_38_59]OGX50252.1 MAG: glutamine synthetase [Omnitrophica WOR_2 bacterium RIFOXYA2_FULL_38_17]OGX54058.1 MAG: glutamine synthetase [Omnitrophica WOR_2 bacterium RIFOXYA12_FULL_38_10]HBG61210.1 glutamine synthetase type III [Candidatus Omnitrophota bacterium]
MEEFTSIADYYGENVFNLKTMRNYLSEEAYKSLSATIKTSGTLDPKIADEVADAMKTWALSKGATHYTHWFQPLTGSTAEKHDAFIDPDNEGGVIIKFSGKELIQGEPDASSFPSGGLRTTFEARGYTGWDPTSPAFIKEGPEAATLCIPTYFIGWKGEALDKKTPLLRSMKALSKQVCRLAEIFGIKSKGKTAYATLGGEQEYFLIDREFYYSRIDLMQTGRTLFGKEPAKHQQMADHYFGAIKSRVMGFMEDLDREMWRLGAPVKTRHNEVSPAQFEIAPVFEQLNLAIDHNMLLMEVMQKVAEKHDLACLLHEKPFSGVNGSGKHNNWSIVGPDEKNWLSPGDNPHDNAKFLVVLCAIIKAVDTYADLLRASIASAGNDHRLGSHEAPPAVISIFLGDQLTDIIEQIEKGGAKSSKKGGVLEIGVDSLPDLPRDATDRNRTSPFAFTGAKFEFRAVGSNANLAGPNIVLNTIVAEALDEICTILEGVSKKDLNATIQKLLQDIVKKHKRILFNGDNYTEEWLREAKKRGLPNLKNTPEALEALRSPANEKVFGKHGVLSKTELASRYEVYKEMYESVIDYEAKLSLDMAKTMIVPAVFSYQEELADSIRSVEGINKTKSTGSRKILKEITDELEGALVKIDTLAAAIKRGNALKTKVAMLDLRSSIDSLEGLVAEDVWPLPSYAEMLFML